VLLSRGHEVLIFISEKEVDSLAIQGRTEFRFEKLPSIGMPRLFSPAVIAFFKRFAASFKLCRRILEDFKPDAVIGMGGFTSTSPILAGKLMGVPTFVHESNAIPGKANRLNGRLANTVLLGFEECQRFFGKTKCVVTGTPIRRSLLKPMQRADALQMFGLDARKRTVLAMGGSQGARGINEALGKAAEVLGKLAADELQVIHLTGPSDEKALFNSYASSGLSAYVAAFCHQMEAAYSAADIAIARSGAASLAEIAHFGLPSILIPYPHAAENHQFLNAQIFQRAGAAIIQEEAETSGRKVAEIIRSLIDKNGEMETMSRNCRALAPDDAAERVADVIEKYK
jgi:UDP-N-acetylglucosamine--N-acetylmuramyl-(pentapeptide) pyrophosphoryl-undecaprenol N-acetylglucosamine transferase